MMVDTSEVQDKSSQVYVEKDFIKPEINVNNRFTNLDLTEETTCGIWFIRGPKLQRYANKKIYVILYGILGCIYLACYSYFTAIITTLEKRFKIPSRTTGMISIGNDFSQLFVSVFLSYYIGQGHRPRWIAGGLYCVAFFCILTALPHILYGPGIDALELTLEHGARYDANASLLAIEMDERKLLCHEEDVASTECRQEEGSFEPQLIFFSAQIISGIGGSLYHTLGIPYMDDNTKKSKTPALLSLSYFLRMLGPATGYALASLCLKSYISPTLTPTIDTKDPRWLGAWWIGWFILALLMIFFATLIGLFPKILPRAAARKAVAEAKMGYEVMGVLKVEDPASFRDMLITFKRLLTNKILMLNNIASIFYIFGYLAYWIYLPKYIETQYNQSASIASLVTGTVGLVFSALGILLAGLVITKWKPSARYMAGWNVVVGFLSVFGILSYAFLGCPANDNNMALSVKEHYMTTSSCSSSCKCDYVPYSPVCAADGKTTFISPCHAGCRQKIIHDGSTIYTDCSCINSTTLEISDGNSSTTSSNIAYPGSCIVDCSYQLYIFLAVVCFMKFSGATGRASNFLVSVRCVEEKDKPVSMGLGLMMISLFAFVPSPIFFGAILDKACLVWGKTCTGTGNCWLYDGQTLRYLLNLIAAGFVTVGTLFDFGVWCAVKDLKIFDEEDDET